MRLVLIVLITFSKIAYAQNNVRVETPFNTFIKNPNVLWAINANDTIRFTNPNLSALLVKKMYVGKIKTAEFLENDSKEEINIQYKSIAENDRLLGGDTIEIPMYDPYGNIYAPIKKRLGPDTMSGLIEISQKFYIEKDKILSYVSYVSPYKKIITFSGLDLGYHPVISAAFNTNYNPTLSPNDTIISLGTTAKEYYVDSILEKNKLKITLGNNLIETLWSSMENNKVGIYTVPDNKKIKLNEIDFLINKETKEIPMFDSTGNQIGSKKIQIEAAPKIFDKITITQQWFYNDTKNIVFCKIPEAILTLKKYPYDYFIKPGEYKIKLVF